MSAGSPRRGHLQTRIMQGCTTVSPQQVTDPTILDSVAGFINEVATYNIPFDTKDQIQWARFEQIDYEVPFENLNGDKIIPSALILILGYSAGIQVWAVPANGEAVEILSWRHGSAKVLRFLPAPHIIGRGLVDLYASKRPLIALCDSTTPSPAHCSLNFLSLATGEQVKVIKFKNPILDVLANRRSVVVTFSERIAIFDTFTLENRLTVTTCYLSPGIYPNPVTLGTRWMAYAEKKLISHRRSSGGNEGEGVQSYTATMLHAAKSLGKGLRELGETVASSLTGNPSFKPGTSTGGGQLSGNGHSDTLQKGVVTILDIENPAIEDKNQQAEEVIAHFTAHTEAIVCLAFDPSGLLLLTADKRGHDFHLFRIHPHPGGPALAAVHHLYILHRGDTTARVQDMCFSPDSRWVAVSTLRGTTHVFPITPYGGNIGVRTHATPHVVNRMSRFHRSAGLVVEGRCNSPVSLFEAPVNSNLPYNNPRLPPYPHPTIVHPLAQIRQPLFIQTGSNTQQRTHVGRPRLNSSSEDNIQIALRLCCYFAPPRAWFENATKSHDTTITKQQTKPVESLFIMSCYGTLLQYDLNPHSLSSVPKEKVCDETPIELTVHAKAQWILQRQFHANDVPLPLTTQNLSFLPQDISPSQSAKSCHLDDRWLSQVEIVTHAGPHRRLWMGPQFTFKTYTTTNSSSLSLNEAQTVDVGRSKPVNMPISTAYPILIESGSASSCEQSPKLLDTYQRFSEEVGGVGELQLKEDLADAMLESPGVRESGGRCVIVSMKPHTTGVAKVVNPLGTVVTVHSDDDMVVDVPEDAVIHENCDEALFRPVVVPKSHLFTENKTSALKTVTPKPKQKAKEELNNAKKCELLQKSCSSPPTEIANVKFEPTEVKNKVQTKVSSRTKIEVPTPKIIETEPVITSKKLKCKSKSISTTKANDSNNVSVLSTMTEALKRNNSDKIKFSNKDIDSMPVLKTLITTPDLMETFNCSIEINKTKEDEIFNFPTFLKDEDVLKEEKFEDACDTAEVLDSCTIVKEEKQKTEKYQGLESDEIVFSSEEEKNSTRKPRKPKTKLGVRLSKGKENSEKVENNMEESTFNVSIAPPKKTWSNIITSKCQQQVEMFEEQQILDLPKVKEVEYGSNIPKKSYSTAAKQHLFEIDPHEDMCDTGILMPEKVYNSSKNLEDFNIVKIDVKLSDDEKQENCGSQTETTESDDSSKVIAMDTEEDSCHPDLAKTTEQNTEKTVKRKSKKKKR